MRERDDDEWMSLPAATRAALMAHSRSLERQLGIDSDSDAEWDSDESGSEPEEEPYSPPAAAPKKSRLTAIFGPDGPVLCPSAVREVKNDFWSPFYSFGKMMSSFGETSSAKSNVATQGLFPELWLMIACHLKRPLPRPDGRAKREDLAQPELATLMRVNKFFNNLVSPLLYRVVVTDSLPKLVHNMGKSASARGIQSKRKLLAQTERLFLEYGSKADPSYIDLMKDGSLIAFFGGSNHEVVAMCRRETLEIRDSARMLNGELESLVSISTGVFLGGQRQVWEPIWMANPPVLDLYARMAEAVTAVSQLFMLPHPSICCSRAEFGPLTYVSTLWSDPVVPKDWVGPKHHIYRAHVSGRGKMGCIPIVAAGDSALYIEMDKKRNEVGLHDAMAGLEDIVERLLWFREGSWKNAPNRAYILANAPISLDIYLPKWMTEGRNLELAKRTLERYVKEYLKKLGVPPERSKKDQWRIKKLESSRACEACGWSASA